MPTSASGTRQGEKLDELRQEKGDRVEIDRQIAPDIFAGSDWDIDEGRQSAASDERGS